MSDYFYKMVPAEELAKLPCHETVCGFLEKLKNDYSDKPALSDTKTTYSYSELYERIGRRRAFINSLNLPKGSKVAIWDRNSLDAMELFLAVMSSGNVAILFPAALQEMQFLGSVLKFDVKAVFVSDEFKPLTEKASARIYSTKEIAAEAAPMADVSKEDLAAIFFTGGTTGTPKGVMLSHGNLMRGAYNGMFMPSSVIGHRYIMFLPLSHIFGAVRSFLSVLFTGSVLYVCADPKTGIGLMPVVKPTCLVLVPGLCEILLGVAKMHGVAFFGGALKVIIAGAANVPPHLVAAFKQINIKVLGGYGLTESSNLVSGNAETLSNPESVGKLYPEQEMRIVNGELWIKGDNVMMGYYNDPEATEAAFEDGWFKTGDLVRCDENGYLYIEGRAKNVIVLKNGENVSPEEIESKFYLDEMVRDCLVKPVQMYGEEVLGIEILPRMSAFEGDAPETINARLQELVNKINNELPSFAKIMRLVVRTEDFKRTGALKVDRKNN